MGLLVNSTKYLRKKMTGILHKHFQKIEEERIFSSSLDESSKTMTSKRDKNITEKEITDQHSS